MVGFHGGWKSLTVHEKYIEDSNPNKINISESILTGKALQGRRFGNSAVEHLHLRLHQQLTKIKLYLLHRLR